MRGPAMKPDHATRTTLSDANPGLRGSDAIWLQRGQRLGEILLTSRKSAGYAWATALMLAGGTLVALAILGPLERGMTAKISPEVISGR